MMNQIVVFEVAIEKMESKFKLSQNRSAQDFGGVVQGLQESPSQNSRELGRWMQNVKND